MAEHPSHSFWYRGQVSHRTKALEKGYPTLVADGERIKERGIDEWIEEQKKRGRTGFVYADIRCYSYGVPDD